MTLSGTIKELPLQECQVFRARKELTLAKEPGNSAEIIHRDTDNDEKPERPGYFLPRIKREEHD